MPDDVFGDTAEHESLKPAGSSCGHRDEVDQIVARCIDQYRSGIPLPLNQSTNRFCTGVAVSFASGDAA